MACPHLTEAFTLLSSPRPSQQVHKEECTLCFDDQDGPEGIDVCLFCLNGGCTGNGDREHSRLHFDKTGHSLVVNVKHTQKPKNADGSAPPPKKLAIAAESDADKYDYTTTPKCLACDPKGKGKELPLTDKLEQVITGIMTAMSSAQQSEVKAWEEEIIACQHTEKLVQPGEARKLELSSLASCIKCELTCNLWLCLTCGNLGCGRAQFGGVGGNSHGLSHFEETGHPVSVKQGTITAEGTADIYCYACNDARIDPNLASHLSHFGINVVDLSKTEKSMTELQLERNLKFDFNMTGEDGKQLEPVYGPGLTGLKNLGNSCYMASVLQSVFALPEFKARYMEAYRPHTLACPSQPAACFECQMDKIADGLLSGRYAVPRKVEEQITSDDELKPGAPIFQAGIRPSMFKALVGKGHEEFSTMRQQDADEFFKHLVTTIQKDTKRLTSSPTDVVAPTHDPTRIFAFGLEQKLQCNQCKRVRYTIESQEAGLSLPVPLRPKAKVEGKQTAEGIHAASNQPSEKVEYETIELSECLDIFTAPEELEYHCPSCNEKVTATKSTLFTSFPQVLAVQVRRFQLVNWVPQKMDVPILVPLNSFDLDRYMGKGKQDGEEELPEQSAEPSSSEPDFDAGAMSQLIAMGFPEIRCKKALLATGNSDAEAAMNWLFVHMEDADIDNPIHFTPKAAAAAGPDTSMLEDMGFSKPQALKALKLNNNNPEMAVAWLFENPDEVGTSEPSAPAPIGGSSKFPASYTLKSFISHKGPSVHSGHYVSHIRTCQNWAFFNDEKVVKAHDDGVSDLSKLAYVYFFERS